MREFDTLKITRKLAQHYAKVYEMDVKDIKIKPDFYNFMTGMFTCGKCGERYKLFHFIHSTLNK